MRNKWIFVWILLLVLLVGCNPAGTTITPEPPAERLEPPLEFPANFLDVHIRLENRLGEKIDTADLVYPEKTEQFAGVAIDGVTEYRTFDYAYQSIGMVIEMGDESWILEGLDIAGELDNPITAGYYTVVLERAGDNVLADLRPEPRPELLSSAIFHLEEAGATVEHQMSTQRRNVFEELTGETVALREILFVDGERVDVYVFESSAEAERLAEAVQPNGSLSYTHNGETITRAMDSNMGAPLLWWQSGHYIYFYEGLNEGLPHMLTLAFDTEPLNQWLTTGGEAVEIRVQNMSDVDFDSVVINFVGQEVDYGSIPAGQNTAYQTVDGAHHYASFRIEASGRTHEAMVIDYVGEVPLPAGNYTYLFDIVDGNPIQTVFNDSDWPILTDLVDKDWYLLRADLADGSEFIPSLAGDRPAYIHFMTEISPNQGDVGYLLTGHTACNGMFGTYLPNNYQSLFLPVVGQNETLCADEVMETERFLNNALNGILFYYIEGDALQLFTESGDTLFFGLEQP